MELETFMSLRMVCLVSVLDDNVQHFPSSALLNLRRFRNGLGLLYGRHTDAGPRAALLPGRRRVEAHAPHELR